MKWHPDKHTTNKELASEKFKEISEAYNYLSNPQNGPNVDNTFTFKNADDIFKNFFGKTQEELFKHNLNIVRNSGF